MNPVKIFLTALPVTLGLLVAPAAQAEWRSHGGGRGGHHEQFEPRHGGYDRGGHGGHGVVGALLGLGAAAVIGGIIASQQQYYQPPPPVQYAPTPGYYADPAYAAPSPYYAPYGYSR